MAHLLLKNSDLLPSAKSFNSRDQDGGDMSCPPTWGRDQGARTPCRVQRPSSSTERDKRGVSPARQLHRGDRQCSEWSLLRLLNLFEFKARAHSGRIESLATIGSAMAPVVQFEIAKMPKSWVGFAGIFQYGEAIGEGLMIVAGLFGDANQPGKSRFIAWFFRGWNSIFSCLW